MIQAGKFASGNKVNDNAKAYLAQQMQGGTSSMDQGINASSDYYGVANAAKPTVDPQVVEQCQNDLRLLQIKADVMNEEAKEARNKFKEVKDKIKTKTNSMNLLSVEKEDALIRLRKVQREVQLITEFQEKEEEELE